MTAAQQSYFTSLTNAADVLVVGISTGRRLLPLHAAAGQRCDQSVEDSFEVTEVLAGFDPAARRGRVLLQGGVRPDFRLRSRSADCPPALPPPPPINYLAKDYGSFRTSSSTG